MILENPSLYFEIKATEANISIDALCDTAGLARSTFTRWKSNSNGATFSSIKKLQSALKKLTSVQKQEKDEQRSSKTSGTVNR